MKTSHFSSSVETRREFVAKTTILAAGIFTAGALPAVEATNQVFSSSGRRKRYVLVGVGVRSLMFQEAVLKTHSEHCEMVGYCDTNLGRLKLACETARKWTGREIPAYAAADFDRMIRETRPDIVIVTTVDGTHDHYLVRAMELGCDVMTEKPMTTDASKCQAILDAQRKTGRKILVTFNYRYSPHRAQVKDLLMSGVIGDVLSVDFNWMLNTIHGADYFRRWHSHKASSGGLMVHKSTHHFDLVNWWLSAVPVTVMAEGKRDFYTPQMARRLGLSSYHERCQTCPEKGKCTFFLDLAANPELKGLYLDNEQYDGYFRDRCVFRPDIDIEDTMNVMVKYDTGATMSYSLNAFCAWEGYHVSFNGTKGRLEHSIGEAGGIYGYGSAAQVAKKDLTRTCIIPLRGAPQEVPLWPASGGHGGGDPLMLADLLVPNRPADKYLRAADERAGAYSILTGVAANRSIQSGKPVRIADLVTGLKLPDYPPMPGHESPLPMPLKMA